MHGFDEYRGWLYHLNAMEYTEDHDWPESDEFKQFAPRNVIHATSDGKGNQTIRDDGPLTIERMRTLDDEVNKHAINFIEKAVSDNKPFFAVGEMLAKLEEPGIADNTIVMFTADNGPEIMTWPDGGMTPFHGEKGTTWEGGVRAPMLISWAGHIPTGTVNNGIFDGMDLLTTFVEAAGGPADLKDKLLEGYKGFMTHLDGYNQMEMLTNNGASKRKEIFSYERDKLQAVRDGDWKAHFVVQNHGWSGPKEELSAPLLFNLRQDTYERT